jgi:hypothetical protein
MSYRPSQTRAPLSLSLVVALAAALFVGNPHAQDTRDRDPRDARHRQYDELLDLNVRDGLVYYRALKAQRGRLDAYVGSLASATVASWPREEQLAFWVNAYNAIVLQTVIDHYPMVQRSRDYPALSIRQIPGAFERSSHRVAGQSLTLDQIEQTVLPTFHDPRVFLALGRGAVGGGRLKSEAFSAARLAQQLEDVARECVSRSQCAEVNPEAGMLRINSVFSWRESQFVQGYADKADPALASRSPIERAAVAFIVPNVLRMEREFLQRNTFTVEFIPFDWTLNDLTGRGGR